MTSLFAARRAAEEFAGLVDGTRTDVADRYAELGDVLTLLRQQPRVEARPEFVSDLRSRLLAAASTELVPVAPALRPVPSLTTPLTGPRRATSRPHRLGSAAAAALVVVGGTTGVAAAASGALPGEGLYSVKRGIETATVALSTSDAGKGSELLRQAGTRLDEIEELAAHGAEASTIRTTLADFEDSASTGAGLMFRSYEASGRSSDIAAVREFASDHRATLRAIADTAPPASTQDFTAAAGVLEAIETRALELCAGCGGADTGADSNASALHTLITAPAATRTARSRTPQSALAAAAEQAAGEVRTAPAPTAPGSTPAPAPAAQDPVTQVIEGITGTGPVTGSLTGTLTEPVTGIVDSLGTATGLEALTDPVASLLDGLG